MLRREKRSEAKIEAFERERLLDEASEKLLGFSNEVTTTDPALRAEQAVILIRSVQHQVSRSSAANGRKR